jgi:LPS O-antigen subunit length determinant protein (WzzB/FepE family)
MLFESFWEILLSGIVLWLFADEFLMKANRKHSAQAIVEQIVGDDIRPV